MARKKATRTPSAPAKAAKPKSVTVKINAGQAQHLAQLKNNADLATAQYQNSVQTLIAGNVEGEGQIEILEITDKHLKLKVHPG